MYLHPPSGYQPQLHLAPNQQHPMQPAPPGWRHPPPAGGPGHQPMKQPASINMVPVGVKHNKNKVANKANLRHALIDGNYGI